MHCDLAGSEGARRCAVFGLLDLVTREDGTRQWAFNGYPLYTYTGDHNADDTEGDISYRYLLNGEELDSIATAGGDNPLNGATALIWVAAVP